MARAKKLTDKKFKAAQTLQKQVMSLRKELERALVAYDRSLGDLSREVEVKEHWRERHKVRKHKRRVRPKNLKPQMF